MKSDLSAARLHLERAFYYLCGNDQFSREARKSIVALMDGVIAIEPSEPLSHKREVEGDRRLHRGKSLPGQLDRLVG